MLLLFHRAHGLDSEHIARVLEKKDFKQFEYIVCFDHKNIRDTTDMGPKGIEDRLTLLGTFDHQRDGDNVIIEDPYFLKDQDFETTFHTCVRACTAFLDSIEYDYV